MIFGWGKKQEEEEEEEIELVTFQGALNKVEPDLKENAKLVQAGLVKAKELVSEALLQRAEMVRLEPKGQAAVATFYVDGIPTPGTRMPAQAGLAVTQMLKLLAGLDIKVRNKPQSGGIKAQYNELPWEVSVDSQPLKEGGGERLIIRFRNTKIPFETPADLGYSEVIRSKIRDLAGEHKGIILVAGPPLSGVTTLATGIVRGIDAYLTTIYIMFTPRREIPHVTEFQKEPGDDLRRSIVRAKRAEAQVLYMEPVRNVELGKTLLEDSEDACMIAEFAAKDAADAIARFTQLSGDPKLVAERLRGVFSQKLVRLLCDKCRQAFRPNPKLLEKVGLNPETKVLYRKYEPPKDEAGNAEEPEHCEKCNGAGFYGRTAMIELIENTDAIKPIIAAGSDPGSLRSAARKEKFPSLQSDGLRLVAEGKTSLEELQRVFKGDA